MESTRWQRLQGLFLDLLEVYPEERLRQVERETGDDPELRRELLEMLRAHEGDSELEIERRLLTVQRSAAGVLEGQRVGAYLVGEEIGRGGMGTVYLAERVEGYRQRVALKVMTADPRIPGLEDRFRRERQILARLTHPNIAQILDGGLTDDGRPFLVMPHVEGRPITRYCEETGLDLRGRLELFRTVCEAVHHAHGNLIVHRDLKPSNILVGQDGQPKLLDFGIAKLLGPDPEAGGLPTSDRTRSELRLLTPEHAAPEQLLDRPITTATDTWALGVLLYELLTGCKPFASDPSNRLELEVAICERDPLLPSQALRRRRAAGTSSSFPKGWARRLTGDLDTVVLQALHKEPERRYRSAEQLAEDLRRYLEGEPVRVRPPTLGYRTRRFLKRNAWQTAGAVGFVAVLMAFAITSTLQSRALERQRDAARLERDTAEQVTRVLVELFETTDPAKLPGGRAMTVEELLKRQSEQVVESLEGQEVVQARLRHILGTVHGAYSRLDDSHRLLEDALRQQLKITGWEDATTLAIYHDLAVHEAQFGNRLHGERMLRHALDLHRSVLDDEHLAVTTSLEALAGALTPGSDEKVRLLEEALERRRQHEQTPGIGTAGALNGLGLAHLEKEQYEEALGLFHQSLAVLEEQLDAGHPFTVKVQGNVSATLLRLNRFAEAERIDRAQIVRLREVYGAESTEVAKALNNLGTALAAAGAWVEAEGVLEESLDLSRQLLGPHHPEVDNTARNLAWVVEFQGRFAEAERLLRAVEADPTDDPRGAALTATQLAGLRLRTGSPETAIADLAGLVRRLETAESGFDAAFLALPQTLLAEALLEGGRYAEAEQLFRQLAAQTEGIYGPEHPRTAGSTCGLASALAGQGQADRARELFEGCLETFSTWGWANPATVARFRQTAAAVEDAG